MIAYLSFEQVFVNLYFVLVGGITPPHLKFFLEILEKRILQRSLFELIKALASKNREVAFDAQVALAEFIGPVLAEVSLAIDSFPGGTVDELALKISA